ncbi:hypothetical protein FACS189449_01160 [Alphaproteobacteria bacterium]|nr:hypothetical protein FACS189449_01160 [Alphaproteobacteria bacterium]
MKTKISDRVFALVLASMGIANAEGTRVADFEASSHIPEYAVPLDGTMAFLSGVENNGAADKEQKNASLPDDVMEYLGEIDESTLTLEEFILKSKLRCLSLCSPLIDSCMRLLDQSPDQESQRYWCRELNRAVEAEFERLIIRIRATDPQESDDMALTAPLCVREWQAMRAQEEARARAESEHRKREQEERTRRDREEAQARAESERRERERDEQARRDREEARASAAIERNRQGFLDYCRKHFALCEDGTFKTRGYKADNKKKFDATGKLAKESKCMMKVIILPEHKGGGASLTQWIKILPLSKEEIAAERAAAQKAEEDRRAAVAAAAQKAEDDRQAAEAAAAAQKAKEGRRAAAAAQKAEDDMRAAQAAEAEEAQRKKEEMRMREEENAQRNRERREKQARIDKEAQEKKAQKEEKRRTAALQAQPKQIEKEQDKKERKNSDRDSCFGGFRLSGDREDSQKLGNSKEKAQRWQANQGRKGKKQGHIKS